MDNGILEIIKTFSDQCTEALSKDKYEDFLGASNAVLNLTFPVRDPNITVWRASIRAMRSHLKLILNEYNTTKEEMSEVKSALINGIPRSVESLRSGNSEGLMNSIYVFMNPVEGLYYRLQDYERGKKKEEKKKTGDDGD